MNYSLGQVIKAGSSPNPRRLTSLGCGVILVHHVGARIVVCVQPETPDHAVNPRGQKDDAVSRIPSALRIRELHRRTSCSCGLVF
jgi:hypothetical protein